MHAVKHKQVKQPKLSLTKFITTSPITHFRFNVRIFIVQSSADYWPSLASELSQLGNFECSVTIRSGEVLCYLENSRISRNELKVLWKDYFERQKQN
jgi:hypothetical protein